MKTIRVALLILPLCLMSRGGVAEEAKRPYPELVENSPFLTPAFKDRMGRRKSVSLNLKFTGYTKVGEVWFFALTDVKAGKHYWLAENVPEDDIKVISFKPKKQLVNVMVGEIGIELTLEHK